ncbi:MAG: HAD-IIIC family phosphatase [Bacteroidota bacterium]
MQSMSPDIAELHVAIASTFTAEPVEKTLSFWLDQFNRPHTVAFAPYNQVFQQLLDPNSLFAQNKASKQNASKQIDALNVIYLRLEDWLQAAPAGAPADEAKAMLLQNAEDLVNAIKVACLRGDAQHLLIFTPFSEKSAADPAKQAILAQTESEIINRLRGTNHIDCLPQHQLLNWYALTGYDNPHTAKAGHVPYTETCYAALASATVRQHAAQERAPYKVIALDCDNTLWQGVCGELGPTGVQITQPFRALQAFMQQQKAEGMLLCLASKNIDADVDAVFEQNPDMLLKPADIVAKRVNWIAKSENIKSLAADLNLGLDSFIFIDDNPVECAEVRANCPDVTVFQLPANPSEIESFLSHIWIFDKLGVTDEDKKRAERYQQNARREQERRSSTSLQDFLKGLNLSINIAAPAKEHYPRIAQLTQRTNQFNATTIRRSEADLERLLTAASLEAAIVQVSDRYGDYGLVGVLLYNFSDYALQVDSLILSCRALGRGVEQSMARYLAEQARSKQIDRIDIAFSETERNLPVLNFLETVATADKTTLEKGTVYQYKTTDLLKIVPLEAATPSVAATKKAATSGPSSANGQVKQIMVSWETIATTLNSAKRIHTQVLRRTVPRPALQTPYIEPQTEQEKQAARIWQDVLGINGIGLDDGFKELGGTSLQLVQIYGGLRGQFDVDLPFTTLFGLPTIRAFIEYLGASPDKSSRANAIQERAARQKAAMEKRKRLQLNLR